MCGGGEVVAADRATERRGMVQHGEGVQRPIARRPIAEAEAEEEADRAAAAAESDCCEGERCRLVKSPQDHV